MVVASGGPYTYGPAKTVETIPKDFRWLNKKDGTRVLQGAYYWTEGWNKVGRDWKDIPEVDEE
jgi:beta-galactosidase GanA